MALQDDIHVFFTIAQTGSISETARILYISQSTVSYRLKSLEDRLECRLVDRSRGQNQCRLTRDGEAFLLIAEKNNNLQNEITSFRNSSKISVIRVGSVESIACFLLDELLSSITRSEESIRIDFTLGDFDRMYKLVTTGLLDIAYVPYLKNIEGVNTAPMFMERFALVCSPGMFPEGKVMHPRDLNFGAGVQFTWFEQNLATWYDHWCSDVVQRPLLKTNSPSLAYNFIKKHRCWTVVPYSMAVRMRTEAGLDVHDLKDGPANRLCYKIELKKSRLRASTALGVWEQGLASLIEDKEYLQSINR